MKTIKLFVLTLLILFAVVPATAQKPGESTNPKDPKAKAILDKVSKNTKSHNTIYIKFSFRLQNKVDGIDETQEGEIWMKGEKYKMLLPGIERVSDGKTIWTYLEDDDECQIYSVGGDDDEEGFSPSQILTIYEKGFNYIYEKEVTIDGKKLDVIKLFPQGGGKPYHSVKIYIDKASNQIYRLEVFGKDGNTFTYTLKSITYDQNMPDSQFVFDESKAGDVQDFRD